MVMCILDVWFSSFLCFLSFSHVHPGIYQYWTRIQQLLL